MQESTVAFLSMTTLKNSARATADDNTLSGLIERVTFHNADTGFCVLRVEVRGFKDLVTVVGSAPSVKAGEYAVATGAWTQNAEFGRQFRADSLRILLPKTTEGMEKYLACGMDMGFGRGYAKKLVKAFGTDVFRVIEEEPERLREIEGIGPKRIDKIKKGWKDQKVIRDIMVFLQGHGVSTSRAVRIYLTYGEDAVKTVQENPYRLSKDIRGIGFKSADQIAKQLGIEPHSLMRARAGIHYAFSEVCANEGHTCLARPMLVSKANELLEIPVDIVQQAIDAELAEKALVADDNPMPEALYPAALYYAEVTVTNSIAKLLTRPLPWPSIAVDKALTWVEQKLTITLAESQKKAVASVLRSKVSVITGGPGVGKTTLVNSILKILAAKKMRIQLAAPTGRAAKRLSESTGAEAKTIHRLLEIDPKNGKFKRNENYRLECDVLVVDECSMIDIILASQLLRAVPDHAAVIFVGDVDQLPSVGPGCFLSDLIDSGAVTVMRLTEVFRQSATSRIVRAAHQINEGSFPLLAAKGEKSDFYFLTEDDAEKIPGLIVDLLERRLPRAYGFDAVRDIQVLCPMNRTANGAGNLNRLVQERVNGHPAAYVERFGTRFGVGDKVMQIENNYDRDVFNGDIGFVTDVDAEEEVLAADFDGRTVTYPFGELDELVLCYATTIHKSQGSEYPVVIMPVTTQHFVMLRRNLIYTGVTRGKKLVVLVGQKRALAMAIKGKQNLLRLSGLRDRLAAIKLQK
jgi:exodeoxyribonuclease V alpha subunit